MPKKCLKNAPTGAELAFQALCDGRALQNISIEDIVAYVESPFSVKEKNKKMYICAVCGPSKKFKGKAEYLDHDLRHTRDGMYDCDEICMELFEGGMELGEEMPEEHQVQKKDKRGRKKLVIPYRTTFELHCIHMKQYHGVSLRKLRLSKCPEEVARYRRLKTQVLEKDWPVGVTYDLVQFLCGGKNSCFEYDKVLATIPANAKNHDEVEAYTVRWKAQTQKRGRKDVTDERNHSKSVFLLSGGAFAVYEFWRLKNVKFTHKAMNYVDTESHFKK